MCILKVKDEIVYEQDADFLGEIKIDKIPKNSESLVWEFILQAMNQL
jgi:hypothetical protein